MNPESTSAEALTLGTHPELTLCISSPGCPSLSSIMSFNEVVDMSKLLARVLSAPPAS